MIAIFIEKKKAGAILAAVVSVSSSNTCKRISTNPSLRVWVAKNKHIHTAADYRSYKLIHKFYWYGDNVIPAPEKWQTGKKMLSEWGTRHLAG